MKARIHITLKNGVLDPQGKAIHQSLEGLGFGGVDDVRQGKFIEIELADGDSESAKAKVCEMCEKLLANTVISSSANAKDTIASTQLHSLCAFAIAQLARRNRETQHALADAGAIPPLVTMLGSPSADMQANVARALASLSRDNAENQAAIARTGAIAPLCALVREGAPLVKEQSAAALWAPGVYPARAGKEGTQ